VTVSRGMLHQTYWFRLRRLRRCSTTVQQQPQPHRATSWNRATAGGSGVRAGLHARSVGNRSGGNAEQQRRFDDEADRTAFAADELDRAAEGDALGRADTTVGYGDEQWLPFEPPATPPPSACGLWGYPITFMVLADARSRASSITASAARVGQAECPSSQARRPPRAPIGHGLSIASECIR
jgi:hypothetical protein